MIELDHAHRPIGVIGAGNMGTGIMAGLISANITAPNEIIASPSRHESLDKLRALGVVVEKDNRAVASKSRTIILAVKPSVVSAVIAEILDHIDHKLVISVAAGVSLAAIESLTRGPVIRVMPNTAVAVREGCVAMTPGSLVTPAHISSCRRIFESVCKVCEVVSEDNIDSMIGISGSGIAYMYVVAEALIDAGVKMGLPRDIAKNFVAQTMVGAGRMIQDTGEHPMQLKDRVTSPGGTTICGIAKLEELGLRNALIKAAEAAKERAQNH